MQNGTQLISTTGESKRHLHLMQKEQKTNLRGVGGHQENKECLSSNLVIHFFIPRLSLLGIAIQALLKFKIQIK